MNQRGSIPAPKTTCDSKTNNLQKDNPVLPRVERSPRQVAAASGTNSPYLQSGAAAGRATGFLPETPLRAVQATRAKLQSFRNVYTVSVQSTHVHAEGRAPRLAEACKLGVLKCNNFQTKPSQFSSTLRSTSEEE